jgi:ApbE superfamily uncharacterized protein (UPF0280 family)
MPLRLRKKARRFDVPVQDLTLRISAAEEMYEEARAAGMHFWEQIQSYAIRNPAFRGSKRPIDMPENAPVIIRQMIEESALAGVGPMFTFRGTLTEFVGRAIAQAVGEVTVSCGEDHFVITRRRARLALGRSSTGRHDEMALVVKPELGPQGIYTALARSPMRSGRADGLVVVARSCTLADAAAAAATAILTKPNSLRSALTYLQRLPGVHGAMVIRGERIGVAGALELAA